MTIDEAIKFAQHAQHLSQEPEVGEFYKMCEESLRAQKGPAKLDRSQWTKCPACPPPLSVWWYCPFCGRPCKEMAWTELERRIGGNRP